MIRGLGVTNKIRKGPHYCIISIFLGTLELCNWHPGWEPLYYTNVCDSYFLSRYNFSFVTAIFLFFAFNLFSTYVCFQQGLKKGFLPLLEIQFLKQKLKFCSFNCSFSRLTFLRKFCPFFETRFYWILIRLIMRSISGRTIQLFNILSQLERQISKFPGAAISFKFFHIYSFQ